MEPDSQTEERPYYIGTALSDLTKNLHMPTKKPCSTRCESLGSSMKAKFGLGSWLLSWYKLTPNGMSYEFGTGLMRSYGRLFEVTLHFDVVA